MGTREEETLGSRLAAARKREGLSQKQLAGRAGLSVPFISEIENDKRKPGADSLLHLADALGVSMDYLMRGEEEGNKIQSERAPTFPATLDRVAQEEGWSYADAAVLLEAQQLFLARRSGKAAKPVDQYTKADWKDLYRFYEELIKNR